MLDTINYWTVSVVAVWYQSQSRVRDTTSSVKVRRAAAARSGKVLWLVRLLFESSMLQLHMR